MIFFLMFFLIKVKGERATCTLIALELHPITTISPNEAFLASEQVKTIFLVQRLCIFVILGPVDTDFFLVLNLKKIGNTCCGELN